MLPFFTARIISSVVQYGVDLSPGYILLIVNCVRFSVEGGEGRRRVRLCPSQRDVVRLPGGGRAVRRRPRRPGEGLEGASAVGQRQTRGVNAVRSIVIMRLALACIPTWK